MAGLWSLAKNCAIRVGSRNTKNVPGHYTNRLDLVNRRRILAGQRAVNCLAGCQWRGEKTRVTGSASWGGYSSTTLWKNKTAGSSASGDSSAMVFSVRASSSIFTLT